MGNDREDKTLPKSQVPFRRKDNGSEMKLEESCSAQPSIQPLGLQQSLKWNNEDPEFVDTVEDTIHRLFERQVQQNPNAPAVCSWDVNFTYAQLNKAAIRIAHYLVMHCRVTPGALIHTCFEKSGWHIVAVLAINKAGAAWVPLDPLHPSQRKQEIIEQTGATIALVSSANTCICADLGLQIVEISHEFDARLAYEEIGNHDTLSINTSASGPAYVLFTSGTTGKPKGIVMEHRALSTSQKALSHRLQLTDTTRILQFSSYVFDASIFEIFAPLISGACVCVPSEDVRLSISGLQDFVKKYKVTWALLTPAFAGTLSPSEFPSLEVMILAGEAVSQTTFDLWFGNVPRLFNGWGPTETCVMSAIHEWKSSDESPLTIGRPVACHCWIVDPENPRILAPIGTDGEIIIHGPTLLREYVANPEATGAVVITSLPDWALHRGTRHWHRMYMTGDLASYNSDGSIKFYRRKDTQAKIRGQRLELGEIESRIKNRLTSVCHVAVDVVRRQTGEALVAFISKTERKQGQKKSRSGSKLDLEFLMPGVETYPDLEQLVDSLRAELPIYMVPSHFFLLRSMPFQLSMKLGRRALRESAEQLSASQLAQFAFVKSEQPTERHEETGSQLADEYKLLRQAWAQLLKTDEGFLDGSSHFLGLGGDSIVAIRLTEVLRSQHKLVLSVQAIFKHPALSDMALQVRPYQEIIEATVHPFTLIESEQTFPSIARAVSECNVMEEQIEDIYPCTPFQIGVMAIFARSPTCYVSTFKFSLPGSIELDKYKAAWDTVHRSLSILRTRIVLSDDGEYQQVIVNERIRWEEEIETSDMQLGKPLARFTLIRESDGQYLFALTIHHALYDGWSLIHILKLVEQSYVESAIFKSIPAYNQFVQKVQVKINEKSAQFWRRALSGASEPSFPRLRERGYQALDDSVCTRLTNIPRQPGAKFTVSTLYQVAWALLLAKYENTTDVVFGCSLSGRNTNLDGINNVYGPTLTTVPVRTAFVPDQSVKSMIESAQEKYFDMMDHEQFGLSNIARLGPHERRVCALRTTLIIQTPDFEDLNTNEGQHIQKFHSESPTIYGMPLTISVHVKEGSEEFITARYDSKLLSETEVTCILQQYTHVVHAISSASETAKICDLDLCSAEDMTRILSLNAVVHKRLNTCIHDLISSTALKLPKKQALQAWDGDLTYAELELLSDQFARYLSSHGVGAETFVPLCIEKSKWAVVAMLGILKAGGAFVPLDPAHPNSRLELILEDVNAKIAVVSTSYIQRLVFVENLMIIPINAASLKTYVTTLSCIINPPNSHNAAYAMFTSGSTGRPKGFVVEHGAYCTGARARAKMLCRNEDSRVLQFASYGFDPSIEDIMTTLIYGGCICVPSAAEMQNNIGRYIRTNDINFANLTPSFVAATIQPTEVSNLKILLCSGEPLTEDIVQAWASKVTLMNGYGPSETCIKCAMNTNVAIGDEPNNIGAAVGANLWIIDPESSERLVPWGAPGELMVEGPCLSRGYFRPGGNANGFIEPPKWLQTLRKNSKTRVFKTGDLVRYNSDGRISFIARKDLQVKINGQRTELGEVEVHLHRILPNSYKATVQMAAIDGLSDKVLTACIAERAEMRNPSSIDRPVRITNLAKMTSTEEWCADAHLLVPKLQHQLARLLPSYMIPSIFFAIDPLPLNINGKVDRRRIMALLSHIQIEEQVKLAGSLTTSETVLLQIWEKSIGRSLSHIDGNANFFDIGGDSLAVIRLVAFSRRQGLRLTVTEIHENPLLKEMAATVSSSFSAMDSVTSTPFSLISHLGNSTDIIRKCAQRCSVSPDEIEDIYPATSNQQHFMVHAIKVPGQCVFQSVFPISAHVDIHKFRLAVDAVVLSHHSLRARLAHINGVWLQVVVQGHVKWKVASNLQTSWNEHALRSMMEGDQLNLFSIVGERVTGGSLFVWTSNHAVFDGWSTSAFVHQINQTYSTGTPPQLQSNYNDLIRHTMKPNVQECETFWSRCFDGNTSKPLCPSLESPLVDFNWHREFIPPSNLTIPVSVPSAILAAWGLVIGHQTQSHDAVVSLFQLGRDPPIPGIEDMVGLLATSVPLRIKAEDKIRVRDFLISTQSQLNSTRPFQYTHPEVIRQSSPSAARGIESMTRCVIHPAEFRTAPEPGAAILERTHRVPVHGECIEITLSFTFGGNNNAIEMDLTFDSRALDSAVVTSLMENFELIFVQLLQAPEDHCLKDLIWQRSSDLQINPIRKTALSRQPGWIPYSE